MDFERQIRKLSKLHALCESASGTPEGDAARKQFDRLLGRCPFEVCAEDFEDHRAELTYRHPIDREIAGPLARAFPVELSGRADAVVTVRGPKIAVLEFVRLFRAFRKEIEGTGFAVLCGLLVATLGRDFVEEAGESPETRRSAKETLEAAKEDPDAWNPVEGMMARADFIAAFAREIKARGNFDKWGERKPRKVDAA